jgi:hypothetical protein
MPGRPGASKLVLYYFQSQHYARCLVAKHVDCGYADAGFRTGANFVFSTPADMNNLEDR